MRRLLCFLACLGLALAATETARACRYSIRDTGFVDFSSSPFRVEFTPDASWSDAQRQALAQAATAVLLDSNLTFATAAAARPGDPASLALLDAHGRSLRLASGTE